MREAGVLEAIKGVTAGESLLGGNVVVHPCRYVVASSAGFAGKIKQAPDIINLRTIGRRIQRQDALDRWIQRQAEDIVIVWTIGQTRRTNAYRLTIKRELPASEFRSGHGAGVREDRDKALPS